MLQGLKALIDTLKKQLEAKQKETIAFQTKYKITFKGENKQQQGASNGDAKGVLV